MSEVERSRKIADIIDRVGQLDKYVADVESRLERFTEEMFGHVHDESKSEDKAVASDACSQISYRLTEIQTVVSNISKEIDLMSAELPQETKK